MVEAELVRIPFHSGRRLLDKLDTGKFDVQAALWLRQTVTYNWQLEADARQFIVSTPLTDKIGFPKTYERFRAIIDSIEIPLDIPLSQINITSPKSDLIRSLRGIICVNVGGEGVWLRRRAEEEVSIKEAYVYRMT